MEVAAVVAAQAAVPLVSLAVAASMVQAAVPTSRHRRLAVRAIAAAARSPAAAIATAHQAAVVVRDDRLPGHALTVLRAVPGKNGMLPTDRAAAAVVAAAEPPPRPLSAAMAAMAVFMARVAVVAAQRAAAGSTARAATARRASLSSPIQRQQQAVATRFSCCRSSAARQDHESAFRVLIGRTRWRGVWSAAISPVLHKAQT
jgi:hypothetical protein